MEIDRDGVLAIVTDGDNDYIFRFITKDNREYIISPFTGKAIRGKSLQSIMTYTENYIKLHKIAKEVKYWRAYLEYIYYMPYKPYNKFTRKDAEYIMNYGYSKTLLGIDAK